MLLNGVVALLPAVHTLLAEETHHIVRVIGVGLKKEASMGKLKRAVISTGLGELDSKAGQSHALWSNLLVRPTGRFVTASSRCRASFLLRLERGKATLVREVLVNIVRSHVETRSRCWLQAEFAVLIQESGRYKLYAGCRVQHEYRRL